jgi:phospholipid N-methyltransferase
VTSRRTIGEYLMFLGKFLRNPRHVGSVAPSSAALGREMARAVPRDAGSIVVELGPGTGALTSHVLAALTPGARFLVVEIDREFCERLRARWPNLDCECGSAAELPAMVAARHWPGVDHVLSGLPFASLPTAVSRAILDAIETSLRPGGTFTTFQYVHAYATPPAARFRADMARRFGPLVSRTLVLRNVPPAYVLTWKR